MIAPPLLVKPCRHCGARVRIGRDLDGKWVIVNAQPAAGGSFVMVVAWNGSGVYLGAPDPGEDVDPLERYALHLHAKVAA